MALSPVETPFSDNTRIFVNPLQFAPHEDFATYPRTLERDCALLSDMGCDIVFAPKEEEIYPELQEYKVNPPARLADMLEGAVRPGFFTGVCTVVLKLFNAVQPVAAVFGKKDYQQLLVIRSMVRQFMLPIKVLPTETVRASTGLALSSRNVYLSEGAARGGSPAPRGAHKSGGRDKGGANGLVRGGERGERCVETAWLEYRLYRDSPPRRPRRALAEPSPGDRLVVLGAARLAGTRLIDNVEI